MVEGKHKREFQEQGHKERQSKRGKLLHFLLLPPLWWFFQYRTVLILESGAYRSWDEVVFVLKTVPNG